MIGRAGLLVQTPPTSRVSSTYRHDELAGYQLSPFLQIVSAWCIQYTCALFCSISVLFVKASQLLFLEKQARLYWKRVVSRKIEIPASVFWKWHWQVRRWAWWRHGRAGKRRSPNKRTSPRIIPLDCEDSDLWKRDRCFLGFSNRLYSNVFWAKTPRSIGVFSSSGCCGNPCMSVYLVLKLSAWYVFSYVDMFLYSAETKILTDSLSAEWVSSKKWL